MLNMNDTPCEAFQSFQSPPNSSADPMMDFFGEAPSQHCANGANLGKEKAIKLSEASLSMVAGGPGYGKPPKKKPMVPVLDAQLGTPTSTQQLKFMSHYTRHPHYPDVKLNTRMPQMTGSTLSTSNLSTNNDAGNQLPWLRELSETNSAAEDSNSHLPILQCSSTLN